MSEDSAMMSKGAAVQAKAKASEQSKQEWVSYVWLDANGEPRCLQTIGDRRDEGSRLEPAAYAVRPIDTGLTGFAPQGDAVFYAHPFAAYESPIQSVQGVILLCRIAKAGGEELDKGQRVAWERGPVTPALTGLDRVEVTQQFYLTTKFVPLSFASNPPKAPGPFGCGVGTDVAVRRQLVGRVLGMLTALRFEVDSMTPLVTPSHWGITLLWDPKTVSTREMANRVMVLRYLVGMVCEEAGLTPLFASKLWKTESAKVWPPSLLCLTGCVMTDGGGVAVHTRLARKLATTHDDLVRATTPGAKADQQVERFVWVENAPGPVHVATHAATGMTRVTDNRIASSANPYVALALWSRCWS